MAREQLRLIRRVRFAVAVGIEVVRTVWRNNVLPGDVFSFPGAPRPVFRMGPLRAAVVVARQRLDGTDPELVFGAETTVGDVARRGTRMSPSTSALVGKHHRARSRKTKPTVGSSDPQPRAKRKR